MNNNTTIHTTYQFYITIPIIIPSSSSYVYLLLSFLIYFVQAGKKIIHSLFCLFLMQSFIQVFCFVINNPNQPCSITIKMSS